MKEKMRVVKLTDNKLKPGQPKIEFSHHYLIRGYFSNG